MKGTILFVAPSAYPLGGVATWLDYICKGLEERGWRVVVGLTSGTWHDVKAYSDKHARLPVTRISSRTGSREGRIRAIKKFVTRVNPELVVGVNVPDCYIAAARHRGANRWPKIVMTIHAMQPDFYEDAKKHAALLDGVVCTNRLACELVKVDSGVNEKRIFYAPYGVAVNARRKVTEAINKPFRLAYVGRLEQCQKLVHDLPPIVQHLEKAGIKSQLIIAGTGPEEIWIKSAFNSRLMDGTVEFLGGIEFHEMNKRVYERVDALIVTSAWETGPIVIWEAMASGVPVVTSQYIGSGLEDSLTNNKNCLIFPTGDTREAAACIMQLMDAHVREKLVRGGYQIVNKKYDRQSSVKAWDRCFTKIMASSLINDAVKESFTITPSGRLDRIFGIGLGETIRSKIGRKYVHQSAGSEWPHSYGTRDPHDSTFWSLAERLDKAAT